MWKVTAYRAPHPSPEPLHPAATAAVTTSVRAAAVVLNWGDGRAPSEPRFTFAKGNAAKLAQVPRYAAGGVRTRFIARDPHLWVFGSAFGPADGALALLRAARRLDAGLRLVWLAGNADQARTARSLGIEWASKESREGFDLTAKAGVVSVTHGFGDVNRYAVGGATIAQCGTGHR